MDVKYSTILSIFFVQWINVWVFYAEDYIIKKVLYLLNLHLALNELTMDWITHNSNGQKLQGFQVLIQLLILSTTDFRYI